MIQAESERPGVRQAGLASARREAGWRARVRTGRLRLLLGGAACLLVLPATSCRPGPWDPLRLGSSIAPFERLPYVQAVDTTGAWVLWRAEATVRDSFLYRVRGDSAWRPAAVERYPVTGRETSESESPAGSMSDRRARLTGLPPGAEVEYVVYADTVGIGPTTFRTSPRPGHGARLRVLAFGDSGWGSESQLRLAELMAGRPWELAIHTGDIAYVNGSEEDFTARHFHVYRALLASVPFFPSAGNHDIRTRGGLPYDRAFVWPAPRPGARYYTFRWGDVRFFALDTSSQGAGDDLRWADGPQYTWLAAALDSASRELDLRWTIAYMHHPLYSHPTGMAGKGSDRRLRRSLAPLFDRYGVDLVLAGHDHHYERSRPIRGGEVVASGCGPVYVVTGGGGGSLYARGVAVAPPGTARIARVHHFLSLGIEAEVIEGRAIGVDGQPIDEFRVHAFAGGSKTAFDCR